MARRRLAHFGAYDHDSYGDALFPHIAEHFLGEEFEVVHIAPTSWRTPWPDARPSISVEEAAARDDWAGVLVGGGDIVQAGHWATANWTGRTGSPLTGLPSLWVGAGLLATRLGIPLVWNAPGVPSALPEPFRLVATWALAEADYLSVRDAPSRLLLEPVAPGLDIAVVPDTALGLEQLWPIGQEALDPVLTVCVSAADRRRRADDLRRGLEIAGEALGTDRVVDLPLMRWQHVDEEGDEAPADDSTTPAQPTLHECAQQIATGCGYLGNSLHGFVTAVAYGRPAALVVPTAAGRPHKYAGFVAAAGGEPLWFVAPSWAAAGELLARRRELEWREGGERRLDEHWKRVGNGLSARSGRKKSARWRDIERELAAQASAQTTYGVAPATVVDVLAAADQRWRDAASTARDEGAQAEAMHEELNDLRRHRAAERRRADRARDDAQRHREVAVEVQAENALLAAQLRAETARSTELARALDEREHELAGLRELHDLALDDFATLFDEHHKMRATLTWRATRPLRDAAARHPAVLDRLRGAVGRIAALRTGARHEGDRDVAPASGRAAPEPPTAGTPTSVAATAVAPTGVGDPGTPAVAPPRPGRAASGPPPPTELRAVPIAAARPPAHDTTSTGRRVLMLCHVLPVEARAGNAYRIARLLRWFADRGDELTLVVCPPADEWPTRGQLADAASTYRRLLVLDRAGRVHHNLGDPSLLASIDGHPVRQVGPLLGEPAVATGRQADLLDMVHALCPDALVELVVLLDAAEAFDVVVAEYVFMTRGLPMIGSGALKVVDTHDVFSSKLANVVDFGITDVYGMDPEQEAELLARADVVLGIQPAETVLLQQLVPDRTVITAGLDFDVVDSPQACQPAVLIVGSNNPLNAKGLVDFLRFAWPKVREQVPNAVLRIVGDVGVVAADATGTLPDGVDVVGRVDDLDAVYADTIVVVNPTVAGTGLKVKTVEALAHLRPVVGFPAAAEGVEGVGEPFLNVVHDWFELAERVVQLLAEPPSGPAREELRAALTDRLSPATVYGCLAEVLDGR